MKFSGLAPPVQRLLLVVMACSLNTLIVQANHPASWTWSTLSSTKACCEKLSAKNPEEESKFEDLPEGKIDIAFIRKMLQPDGMQYDVDIVYEGNPPWYTFGEELGEEYRGNWYPVQSNIISNSEDELLDNCRELCESDAKCTHIDVRYGGLGDGGQCSTWAVSCTDPQCSIDGISYSSHVLTRDTEMACGNQLDDTTRLENHDDSSAGNCANCATGTYAASGSADCVAHTTCGNQLDGTSRLENHDESSAGNCANCATGTSATLSRSSSAISAAGSADCVAEKEKPFNQPNCDGAFTDTIEVDGIESYECRRVDNPEHYIDGNGVVKSCISLGVQDGCSVDGTSLECTIPKDDGAKLKCFGKTQMFESALNSYYPDESGVMQLCAKQDNCAEHLSDYLEREFPGTIAVMDGGRICGLGNDLSFIADAPTFITESNGEKDVCKTAREGYYVDYPGLDTKPCTPQEGCVAHDGTCVQASQTYGQHAADLFVSLDGNGDGIISSEGELAFLTALLESVERSYGDPDHKEGRLPKEQLDLIHQLIATCATISDTNVEGGHGTRMRSEGFCSASELLNQHLELDSEIQDKTMPGTAWQFMSACFHAEKAFGFGQGKVNYAGDFLADGFAFGAWMFAASISTGAKDGGVYTIDNTAVENFLDTAATDMSLPLTTQYNASVEIKDIFNAAFNDLDMARAAKAHADSQALTIDEFYAYLAGDDNVIDLAEFFKYVLPFSKQNDDVTGTNYLYYFEVDGTLRFPESAIEVRPTAYLACLAPASGYTFDADGTVSSCAHPSKNQQSTRCASHGDECIPGTSTRACTDPAEGYYVTADGTAQQCKLQKGCKTHYSFCLGNTGQSPLYDEVGTGKYPNSASAAAELHDTLGCQEPDADYWLGLDFEFADATNTRPPSIAVPLVVYPCTAQAACQSSGHRCMMQHAMTGLIGDGAGVLDMVANPDGTVEHAFSLHDSRELECEVPHEGFWVDRGDDSMRELFSFGQTEVYGKAYECIEQIGCTTSCETSCLDIPMLTGPEDRPVWYNPNIVQRDAYYGERSNLQLCHATAEGYSEDADRVVYEHRCAPYELQAGIVGNSGGGDACNPDQVLFSVTDNECWLECDEGWHAVYKHKSHYHAYKDGDAYDSERDRLFCPIDGDVATTGIICQEDHDHSHGQGKHHDGDVSVGREVVGSVGEVEDEGESTQTDVDQRGVVLDDAFGHTHADDYDAGYGEDAASDDVSVSRHVTDDDGDHDHADIEIVNYTLAYPTDADTTTVSKKGKSRDGANAGLADEGAAVRGGASTAAAVASAVGACAGIVGAIAAIAIAYTTSFEGAIAQMQQKNHNGDIGEGTHLLS